MKKEIVPISTTEDRLDKRIAELKESLQKLQNNANAHIGAIQELERLKADLK